MNAEFTARKGERRAMQELENSVVAHYEIVRHIATGGMSTVYLARDLLTEQQVALKLVARSNAEYCRRFQREARAVASLQHEYILPALDYGECESWCYLAMPYIANGTLRDLAEGHSLAPDIAGRYLSQIATALHYAHQRGIIHRDIKASNILMGEVDGAYLADFGLVKDIANVAETLTETGFMIGTAEYMAPELAEEEATELSDIYALGVVLYLMLTGDVPFKGSTPVGTFMQHLSRRPPRPSLVNPALPAIYDDVVLRALAKEPGRRYQSALDLAWAYQRALDTSMHVNEGKTTMLLSTAALSARASSLVHSPLFQRVAVAVTVVALSSFLLGPSAYLSHESKASGSRLFTDSVVQPLVISGNEEGGLTPTPTRQSGQVGNAGISTTPLLPSSPSTQSTQAVTSSHSITTVGSGSIQNPPLSPGKVVGGGVEPKKAKTLPKPQGPLLPQHRQPSPPKGQPSPQQGQPSSPKGPALPPKNHTTSPIGAGDKNKKGPHLP
jgi:serine/threonine protein kinase